MMNRKILNKKTAVYLNIILIFSLSVVSCNKDESDLLERMAIMESGDSYIGDIENDENYRKLKKDINQFRKVLDEKVDAAEKLGTYYKLIGLKYLDYSMYRLALDAFEQALEIYPENPNVLYNAGLSSARLSKTEGTESLSVELLNQAVRYYQASIAVNNRFSSPMYGLAILYIYELNQPELAIPLLEMYNSVQKSSMNGRFLLAAAHFALGNKNEAVDIYNGIIDKSENETEVESARNNRNTILRGGANDL